MKHINSHKPKISVVVIAYNAEKTIRECFDSLVKQDFKKEDYEIILVNDHSTDNTVEIANSYNMIRIIDQLSGRKGIPQARNYGIKNSKGKIVAFTDADCIVSSQWLRCIDSNFIKRPDLDALGGPLLTYKKNATYVSLNIGFIGEAYGNVGALATNNSAYKKSALFRIGGFDEMLITGEDVDLSWKLELGNYNIQFDKNFIVYHQYRSTIKEFIKEQVNYGVGRTLLINRYPSKFSIFEKHIRILPYITFVYFLFLFLIIFHSMQLFIIVIILGILLVLSFTFGRRYLILNKLLRNEGIFTVLKCLPLFLLIDYANIRGIFFNKLN